MYVDKPLSYEWMESVELSLLAEKKGVLLAVGFNRRYAPLYCEAKRWMQDAGGFDWCSAVKHRVKQQKHSFKQTMYDDLIHILDILLWLGEESCEVHGHQHKIDQEGRMLHTSGNVSFGEATGSYSMVRLAGIDIEKLELHGGGRSVEVTNLETAIFYEHGVMPRTRSYGSWDSLLMRRGFEGIIDHFLQSIDNPQECNIRADLVLESHRLVERLSL